MTTHTHRWAYYDMFPLYQLNRAVRWCLCGLVQQRIFKRDGGSGQWESQNTTYPVIQVERDG